MVSHNTSGTCRRRKVRTSSVIGVVLIRSCSVSRQIADFASKASPNPQPVRLKNRLGWPLQPRTARPTPSAKAASPAERARKLRRREQQRQRAHAAPPGALGGQ